jgi:mycothiol synthase
VPTTVTSPAVPDDLPAIRALVARVAREDGRDPLSDQALTQLASPAVRHAVASDGTRVVGYAQLDGRSLELVAEPAAVDPLLDEFAGEDVLIWSHGAGSRLAGALRRRGFVAARELHQLRRPLGDGLETVPPPAGVELRPFAVGMDEDAWVTVNAAAFATHPEQGSWTRADLEAREREDWFDPSGFLMAWRGTELLGFHWTKIHPNGDGEVYVLAVAPAAQGLGLGKVLLQQGLASLRDRGCREVLLYVDGDNIGAMRLYERAGFERHDLDVQWTTPQSSASIGSVSKT